jgi:hypothetical protein
MYPFITSLNYSVPKFLVISIVLNSIYLMDVHSLMRLYFPEPPTPISIIWPLGYLRTLAILKTCSIASSNKTKFILLELLILYSSRPPWRTLSNFFLS